MDRRIINALETRFRFLDYIRRVKLIDPSISGLAFTHREVSDIDYKRIFIKDKWNSISYEYKNKMKVISNCSTKAYVDKVSKVSSYVTDIIKEIYLEVITNALSDIIVCDYMYDAIVVSINGVEPYYTKNGTYTNEGMDSRYTIPDDAKEILCNVNNIYEIITEALTILKNDFVEAEYDDFLEVDFNNYMIYINVASE